MNNIPKKDSIPVSKIRINSAQSKNQIIFKKPGFSTQPGTIQKKNLPTSPVQPNPTAGSQVQPHTSEELAPQNGLQPSSYPTVEPTSSQEQPSGNRAVRVLTGKALPSAQKTGFKDKEGTVEAVSLDKYFENQIDDIKEQIQNYLEVCDTLSHRPVNMEYLIENLFVFIRSLNFDFMIFLLADKQENNRFSSYVLRGIKIPPPDMPSLLSSAVLNGKISWNEFMKIVSSPDGEFSKWMLSAKICSIGHVPFHDGKDIIGFMIIGAFTKKQKTPIASQLLELCSGRIGMGLSYVAHQNQLVQNVEELAKELGSIQSQTEEYFELLSDSIQDKEGLAAKILSKCKASILQASSKIEALKEIAKRKS